MKNIVKVLRYKDNATRLYQLPEGVILTHGTPVELPFATGTAMGITVSDNYVITDAEETMLRDLLHVRGEFRNVTAIFNREELAHPTDTDADADDDTEDDADDDEE